MENMNAKLQEMYALEKLSKNNTFIHRLNPLVKIIVTIIYIGSVVSMDRYSLFRLAPFLSYHFIMMSLAEIPYAMIFKRTIVALPFCMFAGISNLIFDREIFVIAERFVVTAGVISFFTIIIRTFLCVSAVLILVTVTPFYELTGSLIKIHIPYFFVRLIEMVYRYIVVLAEEASTMLTGYRLRNPKAKWPRISESGAFLGQLFIRSFERANRIYSAMACRGYGKNSRSHININIHIGDIVFLVVGVLSSLIFRLL